MKTCSIPGCGAPVHGYGWCPLHYQRFRYYGDPLGGRRREKLYKPKPRVKFSVDMWDKWRADRTADEHTSVLREGIAEMRSRLASRDIHSKPLSDPR
jgi:hypothetical protein